MRYYKYTLHEAALLFSKLWQYQCTLDGLVVHLTEVWEFMGSLCHISYQSMWPGACYCALHYFGTLLYSYTVSCTIVLMYSLYMAVSPLRVLLPAAHHWQHGGASYWWELLWGVYVCVCTCVLFWFLLGVRTTMAIMYCEQHPCVDKLYYNL